MPISLSSRWWINQLPKDLLPDYAKANLHTILDLTIVEDVKVMIQKYAHFDEMIETNAGCTISCHCGPNTLGILFLRKESKCGS